MKECPIKQTVELIGSKWKLLIIRTLFEDKKGFNELKRELIPISAKVLTENLKDLERSQLIKKTMIQYKPIQVEYHLTELGESLLPIMESLKEWGLYYQKNNKKRLDQK